jgi:hypothetical protein
MICKCDNKHSHVRTRKSKRSIQSQLFLEPTGLSGLRDSFPHWGWQEFINLITALALCRIWPILRFWHAWQRKSECVCVTSSALDIRQESRHQKSLAAARSQWKWISSEIIWWFSVSSVRASSHSKKAAADRSSQGDWLINRQWEYRQRKRYMEESAVNLYQINDGLSNNGVDGCKLCSYAAPDSRVAKLRRSVTLDDLMLAINCYPAVLVLWFG